MADSSELIVHGVYSKNLKRLDSEGKPAYVVVYLENSLSDVRLEKIEEISDLSNIPSIDYGQDNLVKYLQVYDAKQRKLDQDKLDISETTKTAAPNKILYLNSASKLPATATNADALGGLTLDKFSLKTDLGSAPYIKDLSISGTTISYTKGDGSKGTLNTQDNDYRVKNEVNNAIKAYITGTTSSSTNTGTQVFDTGVYLTTTAGELVASKFTGVLNGNANTATKATQDSAGQQINSTYIKGLSISGTTITYTRGNNTTGTLVTQDNDYRVKNDLNTAIKAYITATTSSTSNTGTQVFDTGVYLSTTAGELVASKFTGALNGNAATATKATQDSSGQQITSTYIKTLAISGTTITYTKGNGTTGTLTTQDNDYRVTNTANNSVKAYITGTTSSSTNTGTQVFDTGIYISTTAGELVASKFTGALNGNAASATKATQDASGRVISDTYALKTDIPSVWDSDGHLVSPAGWKLWVEN